MSNWLLLGYPWPHEEVRRGGHGFRVGNNKPFLFLYHNVVREAESKNEERGRVSDIDREHEIERKTEVEQAERRESVRRKQCNGRVCWHAALR